MEPDARNEARFARVDCEVLLPCRTEPMEAVKAREEGSAQDDEGEPRLHDERRREARQVEARPCTLGVLVHAWRTLAASWADHILHRIRDPLGFNGKSRSTTVAEGNTSVKPSLMMLLGSASMQAHSALVVYWSHCE